MANFISRGFGGGRRRAPEEIADYALNWALDPKPIEVGEPAPA